MYVECNIEVRSRNHCCCGKAISIKLLHVLSVCVCVCVCVCYTVCKAHAPYYVVLCGQSGCTIFIHIVS